MMLTRKTGLWLLTCLCVLMTSAADVDAAKKKGGKKGGKKGKDPVVLVLEGKIVTNDISYWFRPDQGQHKIKSIWDMQLDVKKFNKLLKETKGSNPSFPYETIKQCIDQPIALKLQGVEYKDKKKSVLKTTKSTILGMALSKKDLKD